MRDFFIKTFNCEEYAHRFLRNGEMKFSHIVSFQNIEDGRVRGDKTEGLAIEAINADISPNLKMFSIGNLNYGKQYVVDWEGVKRQIPEIENNKGLIQLKLEYEIDCLIYCLTYVNSATPEVDKTLRKCIEFGEYSTVICDCNDFLQRVAKAIPNSRRRFVEYLNEEIKNPFVKPLDYSWQQEYRIIIPACNKTEDLFSIGKLKGFVCSTRSLSVLKNELQ